jgi:hypothetical protein
VRRTSLSRFETYLKTASILGTYVWPHRSSYPSYLLVLEGGVGVIAKPEDEHQEGPIICRREAAAWVVAREMGWGDLVSTTVLRRLISNVGLAQTIASLQVAWPMAGTADASAFSAEDCWRAAVFDAVVRNDDRGGPSNWLAIPRVDLGVTNEPMLKLPDHGYAFRPGVEAPNSVFFTDRAGQQIPDGPMEALRRLAGRLGASEIGDLLPMDMVEGVLERVERLVTGQVLQLAP